MGQPVVHRVLNREFRRRTDPLTQLVMEKLELTSTALLVRPLTLRRIRLPLAPKPMETAPRHRPASRDDSSGPGTRRRGRSRSSLRRDRASSCQPRTARWHMAPSLAPMQNHTKIDMYFDLVGM